MIRVAYKITKDEQAEKRGWHNVRGVGDVIEQIAKPIAVALKLDCLDEKKQLKPESDCAKRRERMNKSLPFTPKQTTT